MVLIIDKTALSRHIAGILHGISSTARVRRKPRIREIAKCDMAEARPVPRPAALPWDRVRRLLNCCPKAPILPGGALLAIARGAVGGV